jgi:glycerol-3-phosphate dehydrogenase subunit B
MRPDVIVVGTGLAGLSAAVRLAQDGARVVVLAKGIGATHLAGATIDVLGYDPARVESPSAALPRLVEEQPGHPYARIGVAAVGEALAWLRVLVAAGPMPSYGYEGGLEENLVLPTAVGAPKPTAMAPVTMLAGDLRAEALRICIVGFRQLKDFHPMLCAENLAAAGVVGRIEARGIELDLPVTGRADVNAQGMAQQLDDPAVRGALVQQLAARLQGDERVGLPAVLGLRDPYAVWAELEHRLGRRVFEIPTLPPSVPGMRLYTILRAALRAAGGRQIIGPEVIGPLGSGPRLEGVRVRVGRREEIRPAGEVVLATGGFASGGLVLDSRWHVRDAALGLPLAGVPEDGAPRFVPRYFDDQPMSRAGIAVDDELRPVDASGEPVYENVRVVGASIAGAVPWKEKSGDGISLASGHRAASLILQSSRAGAAAGATMEAP